MKRIKIADVEAAMTHPRNGVTAIQLPDGSWTCNDAELASLKAGKDKIPGMRVRSNSGRWFTIYLSSMITDLPFPKENDEYVVPDEFFLVSKDFKLYITLP